MTESVTPVPPAPTETGVTEAQIPTENPAVCTVKAALAAHGVYASTTYGQSMEPLFRTHRDLVFLSPPDGPFRRFDVILYPGHHENCLLHRVVGIAKDRTLLVRGDNTFRLEHIPPSDVLAVLTEFTRKKKHHRVTDRSYRLYVRVWNAIYPVRLVVHKVHVLLSAAAHKLLGK